MQFLQSTGCLALILACSCCLAIYNTRNFGRGGRLWPLSGLMWTHIFIAPGIESEMTACDVDITTKLWTVSCHFAGSSIFSSEINFRKAKAFVKIIDSSIFLHIMTRTMIQTKCGDLHEVEVLKVMKTP